MNAYHTCKDKNGETVTYAVAKIIFPQLPCSVVYLKVGMNFDEKRNMMIWDNTTEKIWEEEEDGTMIKTGRKKYCIHNTFGEYTIGLDNITKLHFMYMLYNKLKEN